MVGRRQVAARAEGSAADFTAYALDGDVQTLASSVIEGRMFAGAGEAIVGQALMDALGVRVGDPLRLLVDGKTLDLTDRRADRRARPRRQGRPVRSRHLPRPDRPGGGAHGVPGRGRRRGPPCPAVMNRLRSASGGRVHVWPDGPRRGGRRREDPGDPGRAQPGAGGDRGGQPPLDDDARGAGAFPRPRHLEGGRVDAAPGDRRRAGRGRRGGGGGAWSPASRSVWRRRAGCTTSWGGRPGTAWGSASCPGGSTWRRCCRWWSCWRCWAGSGRRGGRRGCGWRRRCATSEGMPIGSARQEAQSASRPTDSIQLTRRWSAFVGCSGARTVKSIRTIPHATSRRRRTTAAAATKATR